MGYYYDVRGWLKVSEDVGPLITAKLDSLQVRYKPEKRPEDSWPATYMAGWVWSGMASEWTSYLFYGGQMRYRGVELFEETLREILQVGTELYGYFQVDGENGESTSYHVNCSNLTLTEQNPPLIDHKYPPDDDL